MNLNKCIRALQWCGGVVRKVTDQEILDAKAQVGASGLGCEPASAAAFVSYHSDDPRMDSPSLIPGIQAPVLVIAGAWLISRRED